MFIRCGFRYSMPGPATAPRRAVAACVVSAFVAAGWALGSAVAHARGAEAAASAEAARPGALTVHEPWSRATAPGAAVGGGYLVLDNAGADDRLVGASSPVSARVELHSMMMENNVMRMRQVPDIELPAGKRVELRPGGLHLMFVELQAPLEEGRSFPVTLRFEKAGELEITMKVRSMGAGAAGIQHGHGHGGPGAAGEQR